MKKQIFAFAMSVTMLASTCMSVAAEIIAPQNPCVSTRVHSHNENEIHDHSSDEHFSLEEKVKVAVFDTGINDPEIKVAGSVSFVDDKEITNNHGNNMAEVLSSYAQNAEIYDVRVLDNNGEGKYSDIALAIDWSIKNDIDVIAMSFSGNENSAILEKAIKKAEENSVIVIAAAGNNSEEKATFPAAYDSVVAVGALNSDYSYAEYSNYGKYVDTYAYEPLFEGSSASAQQVAGIVASAMEIESDIEEIKDLFMSENKAEVEKATEAVDGTVYAAACTTHTYGSWTVGAAATCSKTGTQYRVCSKCGTTQTSTIAATGHTYGSWTVGAAATCTKTGTQYRACSKCGTTQTSTIAATGQHNFSVYVRTIYSPTCTSTGADTYQCKSCTTTTTKQTSILYHNIITKEIVAPTCTTGGYTLKGCTRCTYSYTINPVSAVAHNYSTYVDTVTSATCIAGGTAKYRCNSCPATTTKSTPISPDNHKYTTQVISPTCVTQGYTKKSCSLCSYSYNTDYKSALKHNYSKLLGVKKQATCSAKGLGIYGCSRCPSTTELDIEKLEHDYDITIVKTVEPTYTEDGYTYHLCKNCPSRESISIIPKKIYKENFEIGNINTDDDYKREMKSYLKSKGLTEDDSQRIINYIDKNGEDIASSNSFLDLMDMIDKIGTFGDWTGDEYLAELSTISTAGTIGYTAISYIKALNDKNGEEILDSFMDFTSAISGLCPLTEGYSRALDELKFYLDETIEKGKKHNYQNAYALMCLDYKTDIPFTLEDLSDEAKYNEFVAYCNEKFKKDAYYVIGFYIQERIDEEFKAATGMTLDEYYDLFCK